jgi:hypothetical protein
MQPPVVQPPVSHPPVQPPVVQPPTPPAATSQTESRPYRRHHFHDVPPWPHQHHGDYIVIEGWGWWPRWYPYWDQRWYAYWWYLYDYYGGDAYPEYAEYARDAVLRQYAPQWGFVVSEVVR